MQVRTIRDADLSGKRALVRVDFNVPMQNGAVTSDARIAAAVPTIEYLLEHGAKVVLMTHLGRPEGKVVEELRTAPLLRKLNEYVQGDIEMLENLRFDAREEADDEGFAKELAARGDLFVNDAFAVSHRAHASTVGVAKFLPSYAGFLMEKEIAELSLALMPPAGSVAIMGGAKLETKIPLLEKLTALYGSVLVGGAIANELLKAHGSKVGSVISSAEPPPSAILNNERIVLPVDVVVEDQTTKEKRTALVDEVRSGEVGFDIGEATAKDWGARIAQAPFVLWNGPSGLYESGYSSGTDALAQALGASAAHAVVGGGNTIEAVSKFSFDPGRVFLSTGGGAMLEFLVAGTLPGIEPLKK
ncbi:MAG TPA: phosphoglycerate kinase [Candidatus Paceibacterota bacterium]|nr:phosphoglycerate kinase [Candidatus Paceibacterota bacterium]